MNSTRCRLSLLAILTVGTVPAALAIEPIPATPGWRGFVVVGGGYADLMSNTVAGNNLIDIGQPWITGASNSPETRTYTMSDSTTTKNRGTSRTGIGAHLGSSRISPTNTAQDDDEVAGNPAITTSLTRRRQSGNGRGARSRRNWRH